MVHTIRNQEGCCHHLRCVAAVFLYLGCVLASSEEPCDFSRGTKQKTCTGKWKKLRYMLHPSQQAVGYAAVKRKLNDDFASKKDAVESMENNPLPFVLGPDNAPFLIDSHHTVRALDESGYDSTEVTLEMICDWSGMNSTLFYDAMIKNNFMEPLGHVTSNVKEILPVRIDPSKSIPDFISRTVDDPWRSFATLVRKVKHKKRCPKGYSDCLRGYFRKCEGNGHLTPFFEFRWAYFFQDAYLRGCEANASSLWDDLEDCKRFHNAYVELPTLSIPDIDLHQWKKAAELLIPLCRGEKAGQYVLPDHLGTPYGGKKLPGYVAGNDTHILEEDPDCLSPTCPTHTLTMHNFTAALEPNKFLRNKTLRI